MSGVLGIAVWVLLVVAAIATGFAVLRLLGKRRHREASRDLSDTVALDQGRLAMLESTPIDETRRLLLVRCDDVEHLIMTGGPVDVVVDNDVRKSRAARNTPKPAMADVAVRRVAPPVEPMRPAQSQAELQEPQPVALAAEVAEQAPEEAGRRDEGPVKHAEPRRRRPRPMDMPERAARPNLTALPAPVRNGAAPAPVARPAAGAAEPNRAPVIPAPRRAEPPAVPLRPAAEARREADLPVAPAQPPSAKPRPRVVERLLGRREPVIAAPPAEVAEEAPAPVRASRAEEPRRNRAASANAAGPEPENARAESASPAWEKSRGEARPAAAAPVENSWAEADSIEGEIVRALRVTDDQAPEQVAEPARPAATRDAAASRDGGAKRAEAPSPASPATTLGDLAERLEEALAREVRAANQNRRGPDPEVDAFGFEPGFSAGGRRVERMEAQPERAQAVQPERAQPERAQPERAQPERVQAERAHAELPRAPEPEQVAPRRQAPIPEPDPRPEPREVRAQAAHQEEAPVINLHPRRREAVDPLEDEMARLLGELTGDTTRR